MSTSTESKFKRVVAQIEIKRNDIWATTRGVESLMSFP
jgi:hypothetical protein